MVHWLETKFADYGCVQAISVFSTSCPVNYGEFCAESISFGCSDGEYMGYCGLRWRTSIGHFLESSDEKMSGTVHLQLALLLRGYWRISLLRSIRYFFLL